MRSVPWSPLQGQPGRSADCSWSGRRRLRLWPLPPSLALSLSPSPICPEIHICIMLVIAGARHMKVGTCNFAFADSTEAHTCYFSSYLSVSIPLAI